MNTAQQAFNSFIGWEHIYFKIKEHSQSDKWLVGKISDKKYWAEMRDRGAEAITLEQYIEMSFGKEMLRKLKKQINKVQGSGMGSLIIKNGSAYNNLPNANAVDTDVLKKIVSNNRFENG